MKPSEIKKVIKASIENKFNVLITGKPGIGKSDSVAQACHESETDMILFHPVVSDPTDFKGMPWVVDGHADFLPFGGLELLIDATRPTLAFMDDIGQAPASVQAALMQLLLAREINGKKISDHVSFVGATNRRQDKAGVQGMLEPVKSRFKTIIELEVDVDDWSQWAITHGMPHELVAFVRLRPDLLDQFKASKDLINTPCPRTVAALGDWVNAGITDYEVLAGAAGEGIAAEFLGFLDIYKQIPVIDAILMNPNSQPVPEEPAALYAVSTALAYRAKDDNFDAILEYTDRMPAEFQSLMIHDATTKNADLAYTEGFQKWGVKNAA